MEKLIITVAPTGAWPSKNDTPYVPLQPPEIAEEVYKCWQAGAAIAHIHVRNDEDKSSMSFEKFKETITLIRETDCDIIINFTTSGDLNATDEERMRHLIELHPDMASFDAGSMNWAHSTVFLNSPKFLEKLATTMEEHNVKPEFEIFDIGMLYNVEFFKKKGIVKTPCHYQFVLGAANGMPATIDNLLYLKNLLPEGSTWSALGIGKNHLPILFSTIAMGGHVRVGMEDNVFYSKGVLAKSNVEFVERTKRIAKEAGREVATPSEARQILGLNK
jgi:uncharacterized protein (DUF849 family)